MSDRACHANLIQGGPGRLPWLTLGWAAAIGAVYGGGAARGIDAAALSFEWQAWWVSALLLMGAVVLAAPTALAVTLMTRRWPHWLRFCLRLCAKAVAFLPMIALAWAAIGYWAGHLGWPIESLLPSLSSPSLASTVWLWLAPIFVLAVPMTAEAAAGALRDLPTAKNRLPRLKWEWLLLLGAVNLPMLEAAFDLHGSTALLMKGLHETDAAKTLSGLMVWLAVAGAAGICGWLWERACAPAASLTKRSEWDAPWGAYEGALVIGMPPRQAWIRHVAPTRARVLWCRLLTAAAWVMVWGVQVAAISGDDRGAALRQASKVALKDSVAPLMAGLWPMLWALSLWLLGRILLPRPPRDRHD